MIGRLGGAFGLPEEGVAVSWRQRVEAAARRCEVQDSARRRAERHRRARSRLSRSPATPAGEADLAAFRADVEAGKVGALYVFDPGPAGSIGDLSWVDRGPQVRGRSRR